MDLPTGTVTFLFTDIEGSTDLWERDEDGARQVLVRHDKIIEQLVEDNEGMLVRPRGEGDSRFAVFEMAPNSIAAAVEIQKAFAGESWPTDEPLRIRMGLHTGNADLREGDYYGSAVNRCARVRSLGHGGQVLLSLATEQLSADYLPDGVELLDLGTHPLKGLKRPEQIFQLVIPDVPSRFPALQTQVGPKHNLPEPPSAFVGRGPEIKDIRSLLSKEGVRLVTLKGLGGIGKTRLSIEVARHAMGNFSEGARFVALAPLDSSDQIVQAFLESLDLRPASQEDPKEFLMQHLRRAELLIVVDNFEHVLEGAGLMAEILERSSALKMIATSRERLGLLGESVYEIRGLEYSEWRTVDQALTSSCAQLFVQGARQIRHEFSLELEDLPHVFRICQLVDGAPLALLLSAGWMDMLSLGQIADEIEASLDFLETELQDAPARQRSVRAVFDTSWERLDATERELFMRLSVFRGGFTLEAAKQVATADLRILGRLADKSFVLREPDSGRYQIHELLRQYGQRRLEDSADASRETRQRHAAYYAELLAAKEGQLKSGIEVEPLDEIEADIENVRRAWRFLAVTGDVGALQRSLFSIWFFHEARCWPQAGRELWTEVERSLSEVSKDEQSEVVANQLRASNAWFALLQGETEQAVTTARRTLAWLEEHGHLAESVFSLLVVALGSQISRSPAEGIDAANKLVDFAKSTGSWWWQLRGKTISAGLSILDGDLEQGERYLEEHDELQSDAGGPWNRYWGRNQHAVIAERHGDHTTAKQINQTVLNSLQSISFLRGMLYTSSNLGRINLVQENLDEAELSFARSLRISWETGMKREMLGHVTDIAKVWKAQNRSAEAAEAVATVLHSPGIDQRVVLRPTLIREEAESLNRELESDLDPDQYKSATQKGSERAVEDQVIRILNELDV